MSKKNSLKPISAILGTAFAVSLAASPIAGAAENPFGMTELSSGYMVADAEGKCGEGMEKKAEGKCGEGKCGEGMEKKAEGTCGEGMEKSHEGKCGEGMDKAAEGKCGEGMEKKAEGKCGEGKCGGDK